MVLVMCSFPCRSGRCTSPLEITAGQLSASQLVPKFAVKAILFPGACLKKAFNGRRPLQIWSTLLQDYNMTDMGPPSADALPRLEVSIHLIILKQLARLTVARVKTLTLEC